ncbi:pancreatic lipase-related protein 2-like isoform X2 [Hyperolius riggenbachi]
MFVKLLLALSVAAAVRACKQICYSRLGCFTDCPPFSGTPERPVSRSPWPPEKIKTHYLLFTRDNLNGYQKFSAFDLGAVGFTNFNSSRNTTFIIHGFLEWGDKRWLVDMCKALLQKVDINCFCVDWHNGVLAAWYTQAANNVRVVGAEIAYFLNYLLDHYDISLSGVHLIGHSLGAQVAAETGRRLNGIGRITGLDPAGPYFSRTPPEVCLDPTDALFVDAIHTDGISIGPLGFGGFGVDHAVGDADFFPNGGKHQPGCGKISIKHGDLDTIIDGLLDGIDIYCNHKRSWEFFIATILHPSGFVAYPAPSYKAFQKGSGFPCDSGECSIMGYYAEEYATDSDFKYNKMFYLNTGHPENFLRWRFHVTVHLTNMAVNGLFGVSLCKNHKCSLYQEIHRGWIDGGRTYTAYIDADLNVDPVDKVMFSWNKIMLDPFHPKLGASAVVLQSLTGQTVEVAEVRRLSCNPAGPSLPSDVTTVATAHTLLPAGEPFLYSKVGGR